MECDIRFKGDVRERLNAATFKNETERIANRFKMETDKRKRLGNRM